MFRNFLFIFIVILGLTFQIDTNLINSPTLTQFDEFSVKYSLALSCSQTSIPYNTFVSLTPIYHQICSSDFISDEWISSLFNLNKNELLSIRFPFKCSITVSNKINTRMNYCVHSISCSLTYKMFTGHYM